MLDLYEQKPQSENLLLKPKVDPSLRSGSKINISVGGAMYLDVSRVSERINQSPSASQLDFVTQYQQYTERCLDSDEYRQQLADLG